MNGSSDGRGAVGLADAINEVRAELLKAQSSGAKEQLRFRLGAVTLEFAVEVAREAGGEAGVKVWIVNVGAKGTVSSTKTHTVSVSMTPEILGDDGRWQDARVGDQVSDRPPAPGSQ